MRLAVRISTARTILLGIFLAAALLQGVSFAGATHQGPGDLNAVDLSVLSYHPFPDPQGDPYGVPAIEVNGTAYDWMTGFYQGFLYPTAVFDGIVTIESTPEGEGGGAFNETLRTYRQTVEDRLVEDAAVALEVSGRISGDVLSVDAVVRPKVALSGAGLEARIVLFEDDVAYGGGNGVFNHRFLVRAHTREAFANGTLNESVPLSATFPIADSWITERLGVVVLVQNMGDATPIFERREVLQSATWTQRQRGPTVQEVRAALLEVSSATWCAACVYADAAVDVLGNDLGVQSTRLVDSGFEYLAPVPWPAVGAAAAFTVGAAWFLRPRRPGGDP